jgi:hypothetical protein
MFSLSLPLSLNGNGTCNSNRNNNSKRMNNSVHACTVQCPYTEKEEVSHKPKKPVWTFAHLIPSSLGIKETIDDIPVSMAF